MRLETAAEAWASYRTKVLPHDAPNVQILECQRAFYAGVYFCLMNLAYNIGDDSTSEEDGILELEKLKAECEAFAKAGGMPLPTPTPPAPVPHAHYNYNSPDANEIREIRPLLQRLGAFIGADLPAGWGFNLLLFTFGEGGNCFYISNADRADMIVAMREFVTRETH